MGSILKLLGSAVLTVVAFRIAESIVDTAQSKVQKEISNYYGMRNLINQKLNKVA